MNDSRDPVLEALFVTTERVELEDDFTAEVMSSVEKRRRNVIIGRFAIVALVLALELLLSAPLHNSIGAATQFLSTALFDMGDGWLAEIFAPMNSIAGLLGVVLLFVHALYRKLVR